jgi:hypothetical protein
VGAAVGKSVGDAVGSADGTAVGFRVGTAEGFAVGFSVGIADGLAVGNADGSAEGAQSGWRWEQQRCNRCRCRTARSQGSRLLRWSLLTRSRMGAVLPWYRSGTPSVQA